MKNISEYFYIFSKLLTSLLLIIFVCLLLYLLINSYKKVDNESSQLKKELETLELQISKNTQSIITMFNKTKISIDEISNNIKNVKNNKEIEGIKKLLEEMRLQINDINIQQKEKVFIGDSDINNSKQINLLIKIIKQKFNNGQTISEEISLLEEILPHNKSNLFDKMLILNLNKFYGLSNLEKEFEKSVKLYTKNNFLLKNQNNIFKFIFEIINVQPSNLSKYQNEELNILMRVKKFIEIKNFEKSLNQIKLISDYRKFFSSWINQVEIYINFNKTIEKFGKLD